MTETLPATHTLSHDARVAADAVAASGGLRVREITEPDGHREAERLFAHIWRRGSGPVPLSADVMRMLSYTGAYVAGAYAGTRLLGAAVGVFADALPGSAVPHLHSHIAGVLPASQGRQIGFSLKLHQRAWALERGFDRITWTFDPLVRRNAYFNLAKLAALPTAYLVDFYGDMEDGINAGHGSDRLMVEWLLTTPRVIAAAAGQPAGPQLPAEGSIRHLVRCGADQSPLTSPDSAAALATCAVPPDIEALRSSSPSLARSWRDAVREALLPAMSDGRRVTGFERDLGYLLSGPARGAR